MRKHTLVILVIIAITLVIGFGATGTSTPTPKDEIISPTITETIEPIEILRSNRLTVYKADGYLQIKSEAIGESYLLQIKSSDGLIKYEYVPYSNDLQTVPLPDTDKATLSLLEKTEESYYKAIERIEFHTKIKDELKRYTVPSVFVYYDSNSLFTITAKQLRDESKSDLDFIIKAFKTVAELPYDFEKYNNVNKLPAFYIPNVDEVLAAQTGICSDKATLLAAMLRSQGIPTKYVTGEVPTGGHAWNEVYIENNWFSIDPTFGTFYTTSEYKPLIYR